MGGERHYTDTHYNSGFNRREIFGNDRVVEGIFFKRNIGMLFFLRNIHIVTTSAVELVSGKRSISYFLKNMNGFQCRVQNRHV